MAAIENIKVSNNGYDLTCELKKFPVSFVNGLRRILISGIPTVVLRDVQILDNTTQIPHEMLKHRVEMLPVNVSPDDASTIKDARVELHVLANKEQKDVQILTTDDFKVENGPASLLLKDRDIGKPGIFLKLRPGESVHIKARLVVDYEGSSQVCTASTKWHVNEDDIQDVRRKFVEDGGDVRHFDNFMYQRYYSRDEKGRPDWFDVFVESVGVVKSKDLLRMAVQILRKRVDEYLKEAIENIKRESDEGSYTISAEQGGHTIGYLFQEVIYGDANVNFIAYDIPHPLKNTMNLRLNTKKTPESILKTAKDMIEEYCSVVEKGL